MKRSNQLEKDLKLYIKLTMLYPKNAAAWRLRSNTLYELGRLKAALKSINTAISLAKKQGLNQFLPEMRDLKQKIISDLKAA